MKTLFVLKWAILKNVIVYYLINTHQPITAHDLQSRRFSLMVELSLSRQCLNGYKWIGCIGKTGGSCVKVFREIKINVKFITGETGNKMW